MDAQMPPVRVLTRWVLSGDSTVEKMTSVYCPFQARVLSTEQCAACEHSSGDEMRRTEPSVSARFCRHPRGQSSSTHPRAATAREVRVVEMMRTEVFCIKADVSIESVTALFVERGFGGAPVVDDRGRPVAIVSKTDLVWESHNGLENTRPTIQATGDDSSSELEDGFHTISCSRPTVSEIMTPEVITVGVSNSLSRVAALMAYERVHRVPVVASTGEVIGMLSSMDILRWLGQTDGYLRGTMESSTRRGSRLHEPHLGQPT